MKTRTVVVTAYHSDPCEVLTLDVQVEYLWRFECPSCPFNCEGWRKSKPNAIDCPNCEEAVIEAMEG